MNPKKNRKIVGMNASRVNGTDSDTEARTRKTKSKKMKRRSHFDSDEQFDSDGSGEEYIPKTSEDESDGTDTSEVLDPFRQPTNALECLNSWEIDDVIDGRRSPTELNDGSSRQTLDGGLSPPSKKSSAGVKCKRQRSSDAPRPATQTGGGRVSASTRSKNAAPDLEQHFPAGASSPFPGDGGPDGSLLIPGICKKENGSRMYAKKQYCLYCQVGFGKISRHLERTHSDKQEVAQAISFPKGSKERRKCLDRLRNKGNFEHNVEVLNSGVGELVPRQQPKKDSQAQSFLHCVHCQGLFGNKLIWKHMSICKFNAARPPKTNAARSKTRAQALCAFAVPPPPGVKVEFWKLLSGMVQSEVYAVVKSDACIMEYGQHLYSRLGYDVAKESYVRQKLRELGRLLICSRETTPLKTIRDHIKPQNFMHVVRAVQRVAGYDGETNAYERPSLALKVGYGLAKVAELVESAAKARKDRRAARDARAFRDLYEARWNELVSAASLRVLRGKKPDDAPRLLPFTEDVQRLHSYLDAQQRCVQGELSAEASPKTWSQLAKITLAQVVLFNRRRARGVSEIPLAAYLSPDPAGPRRDVNAVLSDFEKHLFQHFRRIEVGGKEGGKVPVLLTPGMQRALDLLVSKRRECGVQEGNAYLFARPSALSCSRANDALRRAAGLCGAKSPESLTSTRLRRQLATLSQVLSLSDAELRWLAGFLGRDVRPRRQFYRLPEGTLQLAKISKLLVAMEQGRLAEFKGKSLDDISVDPDETVQVDDKEAAWDSDSQESEMSSNRREEEDVSRTDAAPQEAAQSPKEKRSRAPAQKRPWTKEEVVAVEKHMMSFIASHRVPGKRDCDRCLEREQPALQSRTWLALKFYVKNRITALQRKAST
ncbi:uncharacterized protein [Clinocottus analis]